LKVPLNILVEVAKGWAGSKGRRSRSDMPSLLCPAAIERNVELVDVVCHV